MPVENRPEIPPGAIGHIEFTVSDLERAKCFYRDLFGWTFEEPFPDYALFRTPWGGGGGLYSRKEVPRGESPCVYVKVGNIEYTVHKAEQLGGQIDIPVHRMGSYGLYAHLKDPDGNVIGVYQAPVE